MKTNPRDNKDRPNLVCYDDITNNPILMEEVKRRKQLLYPGGDRMKWLTDGGFTISPKIK